MVPRLLQRFLPMSLLQLLRLAPSMLQELLLWLHLRLLLLLLPLCIQLSLPQLLVLELLPL